MQQATNYSLAELQDVFSQSRVKRKGNLTSVEVVEDSLQEAFLRSLQFRASIGNSRFLKTFQTLSAAAVPTYEFVYHTGFLKQCRNDQAQKLAWVLDNMCSEEPYSFTP